MTVKIQYIKSERYIPITVMDHTSKVFKIYYNRKYL